MRRAASSSSVRMTPSASPSSLPIRFCPPSTRASNRYPLSPPTPRTSQAISCVSASSGCAAIHSTPIRSGAMWPAMLAETGLPDARLFWPTLPDKTRHAPASPASVTAFLIVARRFSGFHCNTTPLRPRRLLHRRVHLFDDPLLLLLVHLGVTLPRPRAVGPPDIPRQQRVPRRHPKPRRRVRPRPLVLRLFLRPHDFLDRRIQIHYLRDLVAGPRVELLDSHERHVRHAPRREIVVDLARAQHETRDGASILRRHRIIDHGTEAPAREIAQVRCGFRQPQQTLRLHQNQRTPIVQLRLPPENMKVLRRRRRISHPLIPLGA